jgi:hypothetical protein
MVRLPTGWDFNYFSADQKRAVFENVSTNAMMYRPWVTLDMATGEMVSELPDQTKESWSESTMNFWEASVSKYENRQNVWQLRTPRTPMKLLHPQPGRGCGDDKFAGLAVSGVDYPLAMTNVGTARCVDAKSAGNLAAFLFEPDGGGRNENNLWITKLEENAMPTLLATNCNFEMLGEDHCAWIGYDKVPEGMVYDTQSKTAWNILEGIPIWTNTIVVLSDVVDKHKTHIPQIESGIAPMVSLRLIPGFGSARFPAQVLCLFSSINVVPAYMAPPLSDFWQFVLLTAQGERYQIKLPKDLSDSVSGQQFWLHNSGKLVVCQPEPPSGSFPKAQFHLIVAELSSRP